MEELKDITKKCVECNIYYKHRNNKRCKPCLFKLGSDGAETGKNLKKYGIKIGISKSKFFYFLYNPELNWNFPTLPEIDLYGNKRIDRKLWMWVIHHENGDHSIDSPWNLCLLLNTEHHIIHNFNGNNPMNYINRDNFIKTIRTKYKQRYLDGKKLDKNKIKYYIMLDWLKKLKKGEYVIDQNICNKVNYYEPYSLRYGINSAIKNNEIDNINLKTNGKEHSYKRWIIEKI